MNGDYEIVEDYYDYVFGKPFNKLKEKLVSILERIPADSIKGISFTGTGGKLASELIAGYL